MAQTISNKLVEGEVVNVRIDGVRYAGPGQIETADGVGWLMPRAALIERVAPKEWPPQAGDVWTGWEDEQQWLAAQQRGGNLLLVNAATGSEWRPSGVLESDGPLRLVYRRGWTPEVVAPEESEQVDKRTARVAGVRALADLIESRDDMDLPYGIDGQIGFGGPDRLADAMDLAASLGIEMGPLKAEGTRTGHHDLGGGVTLTLYAYDLPAPEEPQPPRSLPVLSTVDEPTPVFAPADQPLPQVGGPSHPDGPAVPEISGLARVGWVMQVDHADAHLTGYEDPALTEYVEDGVTSVEHPA